jgi:hypothetical protein
LNTENITLCLTIGKRPQELRQTLESIFSQLSFEHIIAINDFRDEETNQVFRELCPHGTLIVQSEQVGHHRAVDLMYAQVKTPYIFHCEDDWFFDQPLQIDKYIELLDNDPNANIVCLRKVSNFILTEEQQTKIKYYETKPLATSRLDYTHAKWHGYTFNPHIASIEAWKKTGGFYKFKKERDVSIFFRSQGKYNLFLKEGVCHHIGKNSVSYPKNQSFLKKIKSKIYGYPVD